MRTIAAISPTGVSSLISRYSVFVSGIRLDFSLREINSFPDWKTIKCFPVVFQIFSKCFPGYFDFDRQLEIISIISVQAGHSMSDGQYVYDRNLALT